MIRTKVNEFVALGVNDMEDPFWKQLSQKIDEEAAFKKVPGCVDGNPD
jgi:hypothetical protein